MMNVLISGCNGKMGQVITSICDDNPNIQIVAGTDIHAVQKNNYPVFSDPMEFTGYADCVIDFSNPTALPSLLRYCKRNGTAIVLATTGYSETQIHDIEEAAKEIRIFRSANMSLGINILLSLVKQAAKVIGNSWDIEIIEKHHNRKLDAPSGTAIMIADAVASELCERPDYIYDRHCMKRKRQQNEIGISSIRGGTIVGEHDILFAGIDEVLEIKHTAYSREIFAVGAIRAAEYISSLSKPGLYNMESLVSEVIE